MNVSREQYDAIAIGVGGMGSAAVYRLAERGIDVLGIENFDNREEGVSKVLLDP